MYVYVCVCVFACFVSPARQQFCRTYKKQLHRRSQPFEQPCKTEPLIFLGGKEQQHSKAVSNILDQTRGSKAVRRVSSRLVRKSFSIRQHTSAYVRYEDSKATELEARLVVS